MAREYETLNEALNAVDAEVSAQSDKIENILAVIEDKARGGASGVDRGTFIVESDTICSSHHIPHTLGKMPRGYVIWTDDLGEYQPHPKTELISCEININEFYSNATTLRYGTIAYLQRKPDGTSYRGAGTMIYANNPSQYASDSALTYYTSDTCFKAGVTYKWLAWA